jgi:predicted amidohydrolase YtcJ
VDVLVQGGTIALVGPDLWAPPGVAVLSAEGRWLVPGLWDQHVHLTQWALVSSRLDLSGTSGPAEVLERVRARLAAGWTPPPTGLLTGFGHRSATWTEAPTVAALDAVTGSVPTVLISGDGHHGWLNTAAMRFLGLPQREGPLLEAEWFEVYTHLGTLPGAEREAERAVHDAVAAARSRGVVGVVDLEWARTWEQWPQRYAAGLGPWRVRTGVYPDRLDEVVGAGLRTGRTLPATGGLATMGPLKVITDGSLNTRTACCAEPYADAAGLEHPTGVLNLGAEELTDLATRAHAAGFELALHAIGDRAVSTVLDVFEATGARGSVEHAQLLAREDLPRWARLRVRASVQPAHLLDDRVVAEQCWPDRTDRVFVLRGLVGAGIEVVLGSDAPVSPLDPWLAVAAAVHRGDPDEPAWHPEEAITPRQALAASVDGRRVAPGEPGDLVLLDEDPLAPGEPADQARRLRGIQVAATVVAGHLAWVSGPPTG